jgi:hypothetical protein
VPPGRREAPRGDAAEAGRCHRVSFNLHRPDAWTTRGWSAPLGHEREGADDPLPAMGLDPGQWLVGLSVSMTWSRLKLAAF